jgi:flagellar motor switch protein FliM
MKINKEFVMSEKTEDLSKEKIEDEEFIVPAFKDPSDLAGPGIAKIKILNFQRQKKFTKNQIRYLEDIHKNFICSLSELFSRISGEAVEIRLGSIDSVTYEEYLRCGTLPGPSICAKMKPLKGHVLFNFETPFLEEMLRVKFRNENISRDYKPADPDFKKIYRFVKRMLPVLKKSWKGAINLHPKI